MITDKLLLLSSSFANQYFARLDHFTDPVNAGRIDDFLKEHFEAKIAATKDIYLFDGTNAHITINGPMSPCGPDLYDIFYGFGGVSYNDILTGIERAKQDINPYKGSLFLHGDTPGGTVSMVDDVYQALASCDFRTVMLNKGMVASGGMWIGSACDEIIATAPTAFTGSIGVVISCFDISEMLEKIGVKRVVITNHEATDKVPNIGTEEGQKVIREELDAIYSVFKNRVVAGRGGKVTAEMIDALKGCVKIASEAVSIGLIDAIAEKGSASFSVAEYQPRAQAKAKPADKGARNMPLTMEKLRADHSELVAAIESAARSVMITAADLQTQVDAARNEGVAGERARIQAVEAQLIPGHEALIATLKFDGKTTGPEAAAAVVAAEKGVRTAHLAAMEADTPPVVPAAEGGDDTGVDASAPIEERAQAEWDKDGGLRAEFGGKFAAYLAYRKSAEGGRARVMGRK